MYVEENLAHDPEAGSSVTADASGQAEADASSDADSVTADASDHAEAGASTDASTETSDAGEVSDDASAGGSTFTSLYTEVFSQMVFETGTGCGSLYCHTNGTSVATESGLHFSSKQDAYTLLVNAQASSACAGWTRVVPGNPEESLLLQKLIDPPCGARMPKDSEALPAETVERIRSWILAGARND